MTNKFQVGDLVQLKSGGPGMTVRHVPGKQSANYGHEKDQYLCEWFKGATRDKGNFEEHVLQAFTPPSSTKAPNS